MMTGVEETRTSQKIKLTERVLSTLTHAVVNGKPRQRIYLDTERRGFGVSVNPGSKSYFVIRRVKGRQVRFVFNKVGELPLANARIEAEEILQRMSRGHDPVEEQRAERIARERERVNGVTWAEALELTLRSARAKGRSAKTTDGYREAIELYCADWLERPLASFTRREMRERHHKVAADVARGRYRKLKNAEPPSGKATANGLFRVLRAVYNRACREHEELPTGIFMSVDWFPDVRRKAPIGAEGLADLHARIASVKNATRRDLWRLMLFTGLRRGSACSVRWEDVDLARKVLRVPNPKGGEARAFDLPLSEHLVSMLDARRKAHAKLVADVDKMQPWVFPADSESGHIEEPRDDALGITPHDCRRLFLSVAGGMEGVSPYAIKLLVNHALPGADVTAGYMSIAEDDVRRAMELITARMLALCKVKTKRRVAS